MNRIVLCFILFILISGCKKDTSQNGPVNVTLQMQGTSSQSFSLSALNTLILNNGCPNVFADSCQFGVGSGRYLIIANYSGTSTNAANSALSLSLGNGALFPDTSLSYVGYSLLTLNDSIQFAIDTTGVSNYLPVGAQIIYRDANGNVWNSLIGNHTRDGFFLITARGQVLNGACVIYGSFSCTLYNTSGAFKSLTGNFSNLLVRLPT